MRLLGFLLLIPCDRYNCSIVSLAILGDESHSWRPHTFQDSLWGCSIQFEFPVIKLLDYESNWAALETNPNPFAVVVMAHLKTKETHRSPLDRKDWKYRLTTMLYDRGYEEQDILELYNFIDWLMQLPEGLEQQFQVELEQFEEARQMKYVTAIERMAEARGEARGREQERQDLALGMLQENLPLEIIARLTGFSIKELQNLQSQNNL